MNLQNNLKQNIENIYEAEDVENRSWNLQILRVSYIICQKM